MIEFGRVRRGVVWHLLDQAAADTWCRAGDPIVEWTRDQPPLGARPCPRCCDVVDQLARAVDLARTNAKEARPARVDGPVGRVLLIDEDDDGLQVKYQIETVDLVGALARSQGVDA